ncbi:Conserved oligomeric Golgi complex subunit 1 [Orchesella cincta]|uniref:Conserved oligomeric Golgi complex subunit 1 n=1 Tax=Orchesella cincta TaxID=48709 RepID=A0A1D2NDY2_ORCCI|nr:Conserved oligomeric Golgi complex subunit 1 [Orchesella cincta]
MAAPVAIQLAGAMALAGATPPPKSPTSPTVSSPGSQGFPAKTPSPFIDLNVRQVFETRGLDQTKEISKRVNSEIEKKREELRTLVGERYRDLIDAADTIASMNASSATIYGKLSTLRLRMGTLPNQLNSVPKTETVSSSTVFKSSVQLNKEELEIAFELKLSLEAPRVVQKFLDEQKVISATHLYLLFEQSLCQSDKPYRWEFLTNAAKKPLETGATIKNLILKACDEMMDDFSTVPQKLAECIVVKQVLMKSTCKDVLTAFLLQRIQMSEHCLKQTVNRDFVDNVAKTLNDIYIMFIDGQLYSSAVKEIRRPNISVTSFGLKYAPKIVDTFNQESIIIEDSPRASQLAQLLLTSYVHPLKELLNQCFHQNQYLVQQQSFEELNEYQKGTVDVLKHNTDDLMRIVLGTAKTLWSETFYPVFQLKCEQISRLKIEAIFKYLSEEAFPNYRKLDEDFNLMTYIWKASLPATSRASGSSSKDVDLKLKCISPQIAGICEEIEERFLLFLKDFKKLGDFSLKKFISQKILEEWQLFLNREVKNSSSSSLFLGRFVSSMGDLCSTIWKLMDVKDGNELRTNFSNVSEECWTQWANETSEKLLKHLQSKMDIDSKAVSAFMPVAEDFIPEGEEAVKPSIRVPLQISHILHSSLFILCNDLSHVGPQSIPKRVREVFRQSVGSKIIQFYQELIQKSAETPVSPQTAIQLIFDVKFCQWFHLQLKELTDPVIKTLQTSIDPFDMDIVSPKLKVNLKRFLFETHLTLGLLFSEESHSFIAQNFKTKMNMSFPTCNMSLNSPLPLLPV